MAIDTKRECRECGAPYYHLKTCPKHLPGVAVPVGDHAVWCQLNSDHDGPCTTKPETDLEFNPQGQMFASRETIRAALFDAIDAGDNGLGWHFDIDDESDTQSEYRSAFVDAVIAMVADLQSPPFNQTKLENLCDKHKRAALPVPTAAVCGVCQAERKALISGQCVFEGGICVKCGKTEY